LYSATASVRQAYRNLAIYKRIQTDVDPDNNEEYQSSHHSRGPVT